MTPNLVGKRADDPNFVRKCAGGGQTRTKFAGSASPAHRLDVGAWFRSRSLGSAP